MATITMTTALTTRSWIYTTALIVLIIGGLNWGLVGFFGMNLVAVLFGSNSLLTHLIYMLVGIAAVYITVVTIMRRA